MITYREFLREGCEYRQLIWSVTFHDLARMSWINLAIGSDEATIIDMRISPANSAQLFNAVAALKPGNTATIAVQRGDRAVELKVQVALRPPSQRAER